MTEKKDRTVTDVSKAARKFPFGDYAEALLDSCVESEVLKEIPLVSTGVAVVKTYLHFREGKFKKKVEAFVESAGTFSSDDWEEFSATLERKGKKEHFLSELLEMIEQASSDQKAKILGGVFRRLVKEEIEYGQFEDRVRMTNDMLIINVFDFMHCYHNPEVLEQSLGDILVSYRMATRKIELAEKTVNILSNTKEQYIKVSYKLSGIGSAYLATLHQVYKDKIDPKYLVLG
jgi:hypothetical protein